jgi:hypothetical protein
MPSIAHRDLDPLGPRAREDLLRATPIMQVAHHH